MGLVRHPELAAVDRDLASRGWARLPRLPEAELEVLRDLADAFVPSLGAHALATDLGFVELWAEGEAEVRKARQAELARGLAPLLDRCFAGYRAVMFNLWLKSPAAPRSLVPMHRDFALVDERREPAALQLWIPLVDVGAENGGLLFEDGSHRTASPTRQYRPWRALAPDDLVTLRPGRTRPDLAAGEGVVFSNRTLHGSSPNRSAAPRPAVGCVLLPAEARIIHWVHRPPDRHELWGLTDADLADLRPGHLPPGARRLEVVEGPSPPEALALAAGGRVRRRRVPGVAGPAVITGPDGRFLLRPPADLDALEADAGDPASPAVARLADLGMIHGRPGPAPPDPPVEWHHVVRLGATDLDAAGARALAAHLLAGAEGPLDVRLEDDAPLARPATRALVDALVAGGEAAGRPPHLRLTTAGGPVDGATAEWLVAAGVEVVVRLDGLGPAGLPATARGALDHLATAAARRGQGHAAAYLQGLIPVDAEVAAAGPGAAIDACLGAGLRYLELAPATAPERFLDFLAGAVRRVLEVNLAGTPVVARRLALFVESLLATGDRRRIGRTLIYGASGRILTEAGVEVGRVGDAPAELRRRAEAVTAAPAGCAGCPYDPYCASPLTRSAPGVRDPGARAFGTPWCGAAMGTFDLVFDLLGGEEQGALRRVFRGWMAARDAVRARRHPGGRA